jgi:4-amino-4-deoxy-L-arabinose transferase-like glycosyltransferase
MNHTSTLLCILLFLYSYQRTFSSDASTWALIAGVSLGYAALIRPLTAAAIGIPFVCNLLMCTVIKRELKTKKALIFLGGIALMAGVLLLYNYLTNDNPFLFGYQQKHATLGFLGNAQEGPPHTLEGGVINTSNNLIGLNTFLFEWPLPSLIFIFILFTIPQKKNRWDYLFLSSSITLMIGYFFYYFQDYCFGPRFYYSLLPFMIILTARGFFTLSEFLEHKQWNKRKVEVTLYVLLVLCSFYTFSVSLPRLVKKYSNDYWGVTSRIHTAVTEKGITNAIVFLDCWDAPDNTQPNLLYYGSGFQFNSPDLKDEVMYALDLKDKKGELMTAFPAKRYYRCTFLAEGKNTIGEITLTPLSR